MGPIANSKSPGESNNKLNSLMRHYQEDCLNNKLNSLMPRLTFTGPKERAANQCGPYLYVARSARPPPPARIGTLEDQTRPQEGREDFPTEAAVQGNVPPRSRRGPAQPRGRLRGCVNWPRGARQGSLYFQKMLSAQGSLFLQKMLKNA